MKKLLIFYCIGGSIINLFAVDNNIILEKKRMVENSCLDKNGRECDLFIDNLDNCPNILSEKKLAEGRFETLEKIENALKKLSQSHKHHCWVLNLSNNDLARLKKCSGFKDYINKSFKSENNCIQKDCFNTEACLNLNLPKN